MSKRPAPQPSATGTFVIKSRRSPTPYFLSAAIGRTTNDTVEAAHFDTPELARRYALERASWCRQDIWVIDTTNGRIVEV